MPDWYCAVCHTKALPGNSYVPNGGPVVHRGECLDRWLENPERYDELVDSHDTLTRARELAAAASNVHATGMERYQAGSALLDLLTGEGQ